MVARCRAALALGLLGLAAWHPLHTTFTEIVADNRTSTVTVTVRSFTDDLTRAITGAAPSQDRAAAPLADSALARYVTTRLSLIDHTGRVLALGYTGQRRTADLSWLSFSTTAPAGLVGATLSNRLQTELYGDQVNLVQASYADRQETLLFSPGDKARVLP